MTTLTIMRMLPREVDPLVYNMSLEDPGQVSFGGIGGLIGPIAAAFVLTLVKSIMILKGVDQNWAQVIQGTLIVLVVMIGGLALRQRGKNL